MYNTGKDWSSPAFKPTYTGMITNRSNPTPPPSILKGKKCFRREGNKLHVNHQFHGGKDFCTTAEQYTINDNL